MSCETQQQSEELTDCIDQVKTFALQEFDRQIQSHQLYYHTHDHIVQVQRRSQLIFTTIRADLSLDEIAQAERLLDLCVVTHDMIQIFQAQPQPHATRQRSMGVSENATIDQLLDLINSYCSGVFTEVDRAIVRSAIDATICAYDPAEQAIYQPALDDPNLSIVARILALADLGALGIDGIEMYNREGSLLFLEENLDVVPLLTTGEIEQLETIDSSLAENIRQRLLKRSQFQVNFAKSRLARFEDEIEPFPKSAIEKLRREVFQYLKPETVQEVEKMTPISDQSSLTELLEFFNFKQYLQA
ncbi:hypothetical protein [Leptolyngbya sp. AN10]|uniref:hypothetical protein n=1 Tax=Leptolyngbya sp. AN10 TaxID=3423365 RepID=UPI003D316947